jgi:hypothetical protein
LVLSRESGPDGAIVLAQKQIFPEIASCSISQDKEKSDVTATLYRFPNASIEKCPLWSQADIFAVQSRYLLYPRKRTCALPLRMANSGHGASRDLRYEQRLLLLDNRTMTIVDASEWGLARRLFALRRSLTEFAQSLPRSRPHVRHCAQLKTS